MEDINGRQGEDSTSHHSTRTGTYRLNDHILAQRLATLSGCRYTHSDDGDRDGCLEHLAYLQTKIGSGCREEYCHQHTPRDRPRIDLRITAFRRHHRFILFSFLQFPKRIVGQLAFHFQIFHIVTLFFFYVAKVQNFSLSSFLFPLFFLSLPRIICYQLKRML